MPPCPHLPYAPWPLKMHFFLKFRFLGLNLSNFKTVSFNFIQSDLNMTHVKIKLPVTTSSKCDGALKTRFSKKFRFFGLKNFLLFYFLMTKTFFYFFRLDFDSCKISWPYDHAFPTRIGPKKLVFFHEKYIFRLQNFPFDNFFFYNKDISFILLDL